MLSPTPSPTTSMISSNYVTVIWCGIKSHVGSNCNLPSTKFQLLKMQLSRLEAVCKSTCNKRASLGIQCLRSFLKAPLLRQSFMSMPAMSTHVVLVPVTIYVAHHNFNNVACSLKLVIDKPPTAKDCVIVSQATRGTLGSPSPQTNS